VTPAQGVTASTCEGLYEHRCAIRRTVDITTLIDACPFIDDGRKCELRTLAEGRFRMGELVGR